VEMRSVNQLPHILATFPDRRVDAWNPSDQE
jgi:hypothetical protein